MRVAAAGRRAVRVAALAVTLTYMARYQGTRQREGRQKPVPVQDWSAEFMQRIQTNFGDFMRMDLADSTRRTYAAQQEQYKVLCRQMGVPEQPAAEVLARFVVGRAVHGYKLSTIESGVAAVARWGAECGVHGLMSDPMVKHALQVAAKLAVPGTVQKLPLNRQDLVTVLTWLRDRGDFIGCRDAALFIVGWAGMFRCSELVAVDWRDVHFVDRGVMIYVPHSKTDQAGEGAWVFLAESEGSPSITCPVRALRALQQLGKGEGPVFTGKLGGARLSKNTVGVRLKKALAAAGVPDSDLYAAHSLRRGGASYAVKAGVSVRMVQILGRWKSDVVREYLYASPSEAWDAAARLQR